MTPDLPLIAQLKFRPYRKPNGGNGRDNGDDPSPEQIAERCKRIRAGWGKVRLAKEEGTYGKHYTVPEVKLPEGLREHYPEETPT